MTYGFVKCGPITVSVGYCTILGQCNNKCYLSVCKSIWADWSNRRKDDNDKDYITDRFDTDINH